MPTRTAPPTLSTHGAASYMRVGQAVLDAAAHDAPKAGDIVVVINDADTTVNNSLIEDLAGRWTTQAPSRTSIHRFDASQRVLHDMITPDRDGQKVDFELSHPDRAHVQALSRHQPRPTAPMVLAGGVRPRNGHHRRSLGSVRVSTDSQEPADAHRRPGLVRGGRDGRA